jgi:hypothetical protein
MCRCSPSRVLAYMSAIVLIGGSATRAEGAWVTYRNDTTKTILLQESIVVNGQVKRCKPMTLLPGESLREFITGPTTKKIEVFDAQKPNQTIWSGALNCKDESQTFSVSPTGAKVMVTPVANPLNLKK